jgi:glycolate oxidase iron-sulfur subunit
VRDLTEALLGAPEGLPLEPREESVVYQDACHLRHGQGLTDPPRELLRRAGVDPRPASEADLCCGSAGTYNLFQGDMAARLGRRKRDVLLATGARTVVTANPGCALQLEAHLRGSGVEVTTLARFLAGRLPGGG